MSLIFASLTNHHAQHKTGAAAARLRREATMGELERPERPQLLTWGKILLRGIGQVMFQGHAGTGLLFLAGLAVAAPMMAVGALLGTGIGTSLAWLLKFDRRELEDGIHGFNPTLVGIAILFFLDPGKVIPWVLLIGGCAAATATTYLMRRFLWFPTYTAPFVVCTWALLLIANGIAGKGIDHPPESAGTWFITPNTFVGKVLAGEAEVMFGANSLTGALFVAGVALSNWRHGVLLLLGSLVGTLTAVYHSDADRTVAIGIYGYNSALAAVAVYLWRKSLLNPILAALVAVPLTEFFPSTLGVPALTAPFVVASWIVLAIGCVEAYFCTD
jgi:urea transporter